jgi:hypothetical protein
MIESRTKHINKLDNKTKITIIVKFMNQYATHTGNKQQQKKNRFDK